MDDVIPGDATLPDVTAVPFSELFDTKDSDSALAHAVRRLAREVAQPHEALAAFTSYVE